MSIICIYVFKHTFLAFVRISKIIVYQNYTAEGISKRIPLFFPLSWQMKKLRTRETNFSRSHSQKSNFSTFCIWTPPVSMAPSSQSSLWPLLTLGLRKSFRRASCVYSFTSHAQALLERLPVGTYLLVIQIASWHKELRLFIFLHFKIYLESFFLLLTIAVWVLILISSVY